MTAARRPDGRWPTPAQLLLLRVALAEDATTAGAAWRAWRAGGGDVDALDVGSTRLLPLVSRTLREHGVQDPDLGRLRGLHRRSWYVNQRLVHQAASALVALGAAGIPTLLLKGAALVATHETELAVRPMNDIDVLVPPAHARTAVDVLVAAGWSTQGARLDHLMRVRHAVGLRATDGGALDLHWSALQLPGDDAPFWARAVRVQLKGASTRAPGPADQLVIACVHGVGPNPASVRWIADAGLLMRAAGDELDWGSLVDTARARRVTAQLGDAVAVLLDEVGLAVPPRVVAELRAHRSGLPERAAHRACEGAIDRRRHYVVLWDRWRRLRKAPSPPGGRPSSFVGYLADVKEVSGGGELAAALVRSAVRLVRREDERSASGA